MVLQGKVVIVWCVHQSLRSANGPAPARRSASLPTPRPRAGRWRGRPSGDQDIASSAPPVRLRRHSANSRAWGWGGTRSCARSGAPRRPGRPRRGIPSWRASRPGPSGSMGSSGTWLEGRGVEHVPPQARISFHGAVQPHVGPRQGDRLGSAHDIGMQRDGGLHSPNSFPGRSLLSLDRLRHNDQVFLPLAPSRLPQPGYGLLVVDQSNLVLAQELVLGEVSLEHTVTANQELQRRDR